MKKGIGIIMMIFAAIFAVNVQSVQASLYTPTHSTLWFSTDYGVSWTEVEDGSSLDSNPNAGAVTYNGTLDSWIVNVSTGLSKPILGSSTAPVMDLNSVNVTTSKGGTLYILYSDIGFDITGTAYSEVGGTANSSIVFETAKRDGGFFGPVDIISDLGPFSGGAFSGTASGNVSLNPSDTMWLGAEIVETGAGATSFNYHVRVPEPGTLVLLGSGLVGLAFFARRLIKK